jgi:hypothetical protein
MNRLYKYISQVLTVVILAIASAAIVDMAGAQQPQPRKGDADRLRPAQGQPIYPTNTNEFAPREELPDASLKIQNINLEVGTIEPVIPGNYNASPQKVNKSGNFISDPLNAIQIFQEIATPRRD